MAWNDDLVFLDDSEDDSEDVADLQPWRVLVVDDDQDVHEATRFGLAHLLILGRPLGMLHAHSAREALEAARVNGFPLDRIIFEVTEGERIEDGPWFAQILREYKRSGFKTAIDDFGAGYAGLKLLSDFQPDIIKIDMDLVRHVDASRPRQAIVRNLARLCEEMGITVIAEGIETPAERDFVVDCGIRLMQGYLFAKPALRAMAPLREEAFAPAR